MDQQAGGWQCLTRHVLLLNTVHLSSGIKCESIFKISEGRPNPADLLRNREITLMMITSSGDEPDLRDGKDLRRLALTLQVGYSLLPGRPCFHALLP